MNIIRSTAFLALYSCHVMGNMMLDKKGDPSFEAGSIVDTGRELQDCGRCVPNPISGCSYAAPPNDNLLVCPNFCGSNEVIVSCVSAWNDFVNLLCIIAAEWVNITTSVSSIPFYMGLPGTALLLVQSSKTSQTNSLLIYRKYQRRNLWDPRRIEMRSLEKRERRLTYRGATVFWLPSSQEAKM